MSLESQVEESNPNSLLVGIALLLSAVFIFGTVYFALICYKSSVCNAMNIREVTPMSDSLLEMEQSDLQQLSELKWIDKSKGTVHIPISLSMDLVVKDYE
jgi:hypothetical protein